MTNAPTVKKSDIGLSPLDFMLKHVDSHDVLVAKVAEGVYVMGAFLEPENGLDSPWLRVRATLNNWLGKDKIYYMYSLHRTSCCPAHVHTSQRGVVLNELKYLRVSTFAAAQGYLNLFESILIDKLEDYKHDHPKHS